MTEQLTLTAGNGSVTGTPRQGETGRPLLVCIPGGSYNARYFDAPGHRLRLGRDRARVLGRCSEPSGV